MTDTITIDTYTAAWDAAMRPSPPDLGTEVRVALEPDGREWDAFLRVLSPDLRLEFHYFDDDEKVDVYSVTERNEGEGPF